MFIDVGRGDAAWRTFQFLAGARLFFESIQHKMIGHDNMGSFTDIEARDIYTLLLQ
jgi:hypothetical protein